MATRHAPAAEQFGLWEQAVDQAFVPLTVQSAEPERFVSSVGVRRFGPVDLAEIASPPQSVSRTAAGAVAPRPVDTSATARLSRSQRATLARPAMIETR